MIISALSEYYDQLRHEHSDEVGEPGWALIKISYLLVLDQDGQLIDIIPAEDKKGWMKHLPEQSGRSGKSPHPYLLADNSSYLLGIDDEDKPERSIQRFSAAKEAHLAVFSTVQSDAARVLCKFFNTWNPDSALENEAVHRVGGNALRSGGNMSFIFQHCDIADDEAVKVAYEKYRSHSSGDAPIMQCLDSGELEPVARLHPTIKGVVGGESSGTRLVSFNERAFESYGREKEQGLNAPVSKDAAFKYTTALNYLVRDDLHHVRIGDSTVVYWAEREDTKATAVMALMMGNPAAKARLEAESLGRTEDESIRTVMQALSHGKLADVEGLDPNTTFYVLGLAPNGPRLSVRFFVRNSFGNMLENLRKHYERLHVVHSDQARNYLTPYQLLRAADNPKTKKPVIAPELGAALMQSILTDAPYPESLYENMLLRIRATRDDEDKKTGRKTYRIAYERAAFIKAYLIKNVGLYKEGTMETLDTTRDEVAYALGRLFWTLEDLQHTVSPEINTTINDRYFNAAVATPSRVFPSLLKTAQDHYSKLKRTSPGLAYTIDQKIQEETALVKTFPKTLSNEAQGDFILGYYHQKNADIQERKQRKLDKEAINA